MSGWLDLENCNYWKCAIDYIMKDFGDCKAKTLVFRDTFIVKILQSITAHTDTWCCGGGGNLFLWKLQKFQE